MNDCYLLIGTDVFPCTVHEWAAAFSNRRHRIIKRTTLNDGTFISTVFLGLNHAFGEGEPILFETLVFNGEHEGYMERYSTYEQAERGHEETIAMVQRRTTI